MQIAGMIFQTRSAVNV
ncbi:MAG: hypothetical protein ACLU6Y_11385 [Ruminococcus sp.]